VGNLDKVSPRSRRLWGQLGRLGYGADYNPEQWDSATWQEDIKLMGEAGVNLVSLGIFSWAAVQPSPNRYDWGWMDEVLEMLNLGGISVCLATGTASPPAWLVRAHPDVLPVDVAGQKLWHGSRQHFCPSSRTFRAAAADLVQQLAERYGKHPALALWHVGNEYGCHVSACYCDESAGAFRVWLQNRYGSLEELNAAWSTAFWSQHYSDWDEVIPPRHAPTFPNPAQQLDFARFSSDELLACFDQEAAVLRSTTPDVPVTTNFLGIWKPVDSFSWAPHEDLVSHDSYPDPSDPDAAISAAMAFGLMRGAKLGEPWLLMEQAPSAVNWRPNNQPKSDAQYRLWSWQAIAHGANGVLSFQWRASRGGAEKFHSAMVPHAGADHQVFRRVAALGKELRDSKDLVSSRPGRADVAMMWDWPSWWALELPSRPSTHLRALELAQLYFGALWRKTIPVDLVATDADLAGYRLVVAPNLYLLGSRTAERLTHWTETGGHLAIGPFSGIVDENDRVHRGAYPGALRDLLGLTVAQFWPLAPTASIGVRHSSDYRGRGRLWSEELALADAQADASFDTGELAGLPALTHVARGTGRASYAATHLEPDILGRWMEDLADLAGVRPLLPNAPTGVEAQVRRGGDVDWLFVLNHRSDTVNLELPDGYEPHGDSGSGGRIALRGQDIALLRRTHPAVL
jgi:beta-galactosidase